ncbi:MAG: small multi-drug export protein [Candidatus Cloacimonetes bacterium]|nr:small multi-drug export protein [Candidatus Cloacimonadota bacterium]MCF7814806.1 small multi-drug export protein [Candidatus Cloacimonadota bacterium]MCF7869199.1 small multi-drug export protein [Candidatus Cloacimonadota bacterium]MCF7884626.1 small multi-drug export protein [Candidatus Cloacimonadota bacterium]
MNIRIFLIFIILFSSFSFLFASGLKDSIKAKVDSINVSDEVRVFLLAMLPIFELRGSIPMGIHYYHLPYWKVIPISLAGNMIPIFFILLFFGFITKICFKFKFTRKILEAVFRRTRSKSEIIEKYEEVGLMIFVAIPLPVTGAWTGSLAAYLMGLSFWKSILFIFLGVFIASVVVSFLTSLKWLGAIIAILALSYVIISGHVRKKKKKLNKVS